MIKPDLRRPVRGPVWHREPQTHDGSGLSKGRCLTGWVWLCQISTQPDAIPNLKDYILLRILVNVTVLSLFPPFP